MVAATGLGSKARDVGHEFRVLFHQCVAALAAGLGGLTHGEMQSSVETFGAPQAMEEIVMIPGIGLGSSLPIPPAQQMIAQQAHVAKRA